EIADRASVLTLSAKRLAESGEQSRAHFRLLAQVAADLAACILEQLRRGHGLALVGHRIGGREDVEHELRHLLGALALLRRAVALPRDALRLDGHRDRERDDENQERRAGRDAEGMTAHEALRVVEPVALTSGHGLAREIAADVRGQLFDRAV